MFQGNEADGYQVRGAGASWLGQAGLGGRWAEALTRALERPGTCLHSFAFLSVVKREEGKWGLEREPNRQGSPWRADRGLP